MISYILVSIVSFILSVVAIISLYMTNRKSRRRIDDLDAKYAKTLDVFKDMTQKMHDAILEKYAMLFHQSKQSDHNNNLTPNA